MIVSNENITKLAEDVEIHANHLSVVWCLYGLIEKGPTAVDRPSKKGRYGSLFLIIPCTVQAIFATIAVYALRRKWVL